MPLTYTNRLVELGGTEHPSVLDLAVGMSRQPRFGGQTRQCWSVLDHALLCDDMVRAMDNTLLREWRLAMLLHDAHEALTGDVPSPFKTNDLRLVQRQLDRLIMRAFFPGGYAAYLSRHAEVTAIDHRALVVEAHVVLTFRASSHRLDLLFGELDAQTTEDVHDLKAALTLRVPILGVPPLKMGQEDHPAVQEFLRRMVELL